MSIPIIITDPPPPPETPTGDDVPYHDPCEYDGPTPHAMYQGAGELGPEYGGQEMEFPPGMDLDPRWIAVGGIHPSSADLKFPAWTPNPCPAESEQGASAGGSESSSSPEPAAADWVISHNGELTFNPFPSFNYRHHQDVALSIVDGLNKLASPGAPVTTQHGTVTVNDDFTLTYRPHNQGSNDLMTSGELQPQYDAWGNPVRYLVNDTFTPHIVATSSLGGWFTPEKALSSSPVQLGIANELPVRRGHRFHDPHRIPTTADQRFELDAAVFADLNTAYRIDLNDLFIDPDGDPLKILLLKRADGANDEHADELKASLGTLNGQDKELVFRRISDTVIEIENPLTQANVQDGSWQPEGAAGLISFSLVVTDGQQINDEANPDIEDYATWEVQIDVRPMQEDITSTVWKTQNSVPEVEFRPWVSEVTPHSEAESWSITPISRTAQLASENSQWIGAADVDLNSGAFRVYHDLILDGSGGGSELALPGLVYDSSTVETRPVIQALIERIQFAGDDPSQIDATLTWYDHTNTNQSSENSSGGRPLVSTVSYDVSADPSDTYIVALQPAEAPLVTGLYGWELEVTLTVNSESFTFTTSGETPVVVRRSVDHSQFGDSSPLKWDRTAALGAGWDLQGVPALHLEQRHDDGGSAYQTLDDRFLLVFPGAAPHLFNAQPLTLDPNYTGPLEGLQFGSLAIGHDGFADPLELGTLRAESDDFIVYNLHGIEYWFKRYDEQVNSSQSTTAAHYLIDRIEQVGLDFDPQNPGSGRRGLSFTWDRDETPVRLTEIIASDGAKTQLDYNTQGYVTAVKLVDDQENVLREVQLTISGQNELDQIHHLNALDASITGLTANTAIRQFDYDNGLLALDEWYEQDTTGLAVRSNEFTFLRDPSGTEPGLPQSRMLAAVEVGYGSILHEVSPAALAGLLVTDNGAGGNTPVIAHLDDLLGRVKTAALDLQKYDEAAEQPVDNPGDYVTDYRFLWEGILIAVEDFFHEEGQSDPTLIGKQVWDIDPVGLPKTHRLLVQNTPSETWRSTYYWRDYETPPSYTTDDPNYEYDDSPKYDPDDYRNNLTYLVTPAGLTIFEHQTDDEARDESGAVVFGVTNEALGALLKTIDKPLVWADLANVPNTAIQPVVTEHERDYLGRLVSQRTLRGDKDPLIDPEMFLPGPLPADAPTVPSIDYIPMEDRDQVESWQYANGLLATYISPSGLTTDYTYTNDPDTPPRLIEIQVTDQGLDLEDDDDDEIHITQFQYDAYGYMDRVSSYLGAVASDNRLLVTDSDYDALGNLRQERVWGDQDDATAAILSHVKYEYAPDGLVTETILVRGGQEVRSDLSYNEAGQLVQTRQFKGQYYTTLFNGYVQPLEQTTTYQYYADGSLKSVKLPHDIVPSVQEQSSNLTEPV